MRQLKINKSITNRQSAALDKYLVEIGREELISTDEEVELAQRIHRGGPDGQAALDFLFFRISCPAPVCLVRNAQKNNSIIFSSSIIAPPPFGIHLYTTVLAANTK